MKPPSGYKEICRLEIEDYTKRNSKEGNNLHAAFILGPSKAVRSHGDIKCEYENKDSEENNQEGPSDNNSQESSSSNEDTNNNESYHYSIFESYNKIKKIFEADEENTSDTNDKPAEDEQPEATRFEPGGARLNVRVNLPDNGCTIWTLQFDKRIDEAGVNKVVTILKSGEFLKAFKEASNSIKSRAGFVVVSAVTYINPNEGAHAPYIGHCNYGFDAGSKDDASDTTVCIAIAPIIAGSKKPVQKHIFVAVYDIMGDIADSKIDKLVSLFSKKDRGNFSWDDESNADSIIDEISKYLHNNYATAGDPTMYKDFLKVKEFVNSKLAKGDLVFNKEKSTNIQQYKSKFNGGDLAYF